MNADAAESTDFNAVYANTFHLSEMPCAAYFVLRMSHTLKKLRLVRDSFLLQRFRSTRVGEKHSSESLKTSSLSAELLTCT